MVYPIFGKRYKCKSCRSHDLCEQCKKDGKYTDHEFETLYGCDHCFRFYGFNDLKAKKNHEQNAHTCNFCDTFFDGDDFEEEKGKHLKDVHKGKAKNYCCLVPNLVTRNIEKLWLSLLPTE